MKQRLKFYGYFLTTEPSRQNNETNCRLFRKSKKNQNSDKNVFLWADITNGKPFERKMLYWKDGQRKKCGWSDAADDRNSFVWWDEESPFREMERVKSQRSVTLSRWLWGAFRVDPCVNNNNLAQSCIKDRSDKIPKCIMLP